jgi:hypothetical protein
MLATIRHHSRRKVPVLLLVLLLCVQSLGFASHGLSVKLPMQANIALQVATPCHDMAEIQTVLERASEHAMPCCDDGQCADAQCMMPAGTHFAGIARNFFIAYSADELITETPSISSIKPSPPIRPPIA